MSKPVKPAGKDTSESRRLKLHGSGDKRVYFKATQCAAADAQAAAQKKNRRP